MLIIVMIKHNKNPTYVKGSVQYIENIDTNMSNTMQAFVKSVAVLSMKILRVARVIFECSPLKKKI